MERECSLLLNELSTLNYQKYLIQSHYQTLLPPSEFDVATYTLHVIIRFLLTDAVPVFSQYLLAKKCSIQSDAALIGTFYVALEKYLKYTPKISPEAFLDRFPGEIRTFEKLHFERLRTVRIFAKLLIQLYSKWAKLSTKRGLDNNHFMVLLDNRCDVAHPDYNDFGYLVKLTYKVVNPYESNPERFSNVLVVPVNEIGEAMVEKLRKQFILGDQQAPDYKDHRSSGLPPKGSAAYDFDIQVAKPARVYRRNNRDSSTYSETVSSAAYSTRSREYSSDYSVDSSDEQNSTNSISESSDEYSGDDSRRRRKTSQNAQHKRYHSHKAAHKRRSANRDESRRTAYESASKQKPLESFSNNARREAAMAEEAAQQRYVAYAREYNEIRDLVSSYVPERYKTEYGNRRELELQSIYKTALDQTPNEFTGSKPQPSDEDKERDEEAQRSRRINDLIYGQYPLQTAETEDLAAKYLGQSNTQQTAHMNAHLTGTDPLATYHLGDYGYFGSNVPYNYPDNFAHAGKAYYYYNEIGDQPSSIPDAKARQPPSYYTNTLMNQPTSYYDARNELYPVQIPISSPKFAVPQSVSEANISQMRELNRSAQLAPEVDVADVPGIMLPQNNVLDSATPYDITNMPQTERIPVIQPPSYDSAISFAGAPQNGVVQSAYESVPEYKDIKIVPPPEEANGAAYNREVPYSDTYQQLNYYPLNFDAYQQSQQYGLDLFYHAYDYQSHGSSFLEFKYPQELSAMANYPSKSDNSSKLLNYQATEYFAGDSAVYCNNAPKTGQGNQSKVESAYIPAYNSAINAILDKYRDYLPGGGYYPTSSSEKNANTQDASRFYEKPPKPRISEPAFESHYPLYSLNDSQSQHAFSEPLYGSYQQFYGYYPWEIGYYQSEAVRAPVSGLQEYKSSYTAHSHSADRKSVSFVPEVEFRFESGRLHPETADQADLLQENSELPANDVRKGVTISSNSYDEQIKALTQNFSRPDIPRLSNAGSSNTGTSGGSGSYQQRLYTAPRKAYSEGASFPDSLPNSFGTANELARTSQQTTDGDQINAVVRTIANQLNYSANILNEITDSGASNLSASQRQLYETYKALQQAQRLIRQSRVSFSKSEASDGLKREEMLKELEELKKSEKLLYYSREQRQRIDLAKDQNTARLYALLQKGYSLLKDMNAIGGINFSSDDARETEDIDRRSSLQSSTK